MERDVRARLSPAEGRKFGLTVGGALLALGGLLLWRGRGGLSPWIGGAGLALVLGGLIVPGRLGPVHRAWMGLAHALSRVTTPVFMSLLYFLVLTPFGLVMRALGRRPLRHAERDGSYWTSREEGPPGSLERQF
ncbi:MAG: SxtJ family membrane protein [Gemmatimonadota bacterium]